MKISERFEGCIIGGAIGDAFGSGFENIIEKNDNNVFYPFGKPEKKIPEWNITDDTQLTLATCDVIIENKEIKTEKFAEKFLEYYIQKKISGIGSSTLKALRELDIGVKLAEKVNMQQETELQCELLRLHLSKKFQKNK
jgi:ADP-ribosyl-[dinitrogen reductase] hydrolase